jgi:hypothetical protein
MDIIGLLRKAESKLAKQAERIGKELSSVRAAIQSLAGRANRKPSKRKLSAASRAKIAKAQRARWAKIRKETGKA